MFKVNTSDGKTYCIDLNNEEQAKFWLNKLKSNNFQKEITGIIIVQDYPRRIKCEICNNSNDIICGSCGTSFSEDPFIKTNFQCSLSNPKNSTSNFYKLEDIKQKNGSKMHGGKKVICFSDDNIVTIMAHKNQPSIRVTLHKHGKQRYNPYST